MYYLISNENSEYQIIDDEIIKKVRYGLAHYW